MKFPCNCEAGFWQGHCLSCGKALETAMDDDQGDIDSAAEHQQQLDDTRRREDELLARAPKAHEELKRISHETAETVKALNWAIDRIFRT